MTDPSSCVVLFTPVYEDPTFLGEPSGKPGVVWVPDQLSANIVQLALESPVAGKRKEVVYLSFPG